MSVSVVTFLDALFVEFHLCHSPALDPSEGRSRRALQPESIPLAGAETARWPPPPLLSRVHLRPNTVPTRPARSPWSPARRSGGPA